MTQTESIKIWVDGSIDAMDTAQKLFESKKYHHALFFLHLALEKIIKALYISKLDESPPYIHDLKALIVLTNEDIEKDELKQLGEISKFNVSARYDDYKYKIFKLATKEYASEWIKIGKKLYEKYQKDCK